MKNGYTHEESERYDPSLAVIHAFVRSLFVGFMGWSVHSSGLSSFRITVASTVSFEMLSVDGIN